MDKYFLAVRPQERRSVLRNHFAYALVTGVVLLVSAFFPLDRVPFRICMFYRITGYPCMTCGWTRGFVAMARGHWLTALADCPAVALLFFVVVAVFAWNAAAVVFGVNISRGPALRLNGRRLFWVCVAILAIVMMNWFYRLAMGLD